MPANVRFDTEAAGSKLRYAQSIAAVAARSGRAMLIICGHLHLIPFAKVLGVRFGCPVLPIVYGIEAWNPTTHGIVNRLCRQIETFVTIRHMTADRLKQWAGIPDARSYYLPNCVDIHSYGVAPRRADLVAKYGLQGRTVVMTAGRLDSTPYERNKGFDEMIQTLSLLLKDIPEVIYLIMGDGDDRPRLEDKARTFGVADRVIFTGYVEETEKADHYRLADVVAMPGSNPFFDRYPFRFAFLEPLACGVPVVGAELQDATERRDMHANQLIIQVNPEQPADIKRGILAALRRGSGMAPALANFSYEAFETKAHAIVSEVLQRS